MKSIMINGDHMKKRITVIIVSILAVILFVFLTVFLIFPGCLNLARKVGYVMEKAEFIGWFKIQDLKPADFERIEIYDTGPSFHGDGDRIYRLSLHEGKTIATDSWDDLPLKGKAKKIWDGILKNMKHQPDEELPLFENGKYLFVDKHPELKNSTNVICVMYDEDSGKYYYFTMDT